MQVSSVKANEVKIDQGHSRQEVKTLGQTEEAFMHLFNNHSNTVYQEQCLALWIQYK